MKNLKLSQKIYFFLFLLIGFTMGVDAQPRASQKASVKQYLGDAEVTFVFSRPGVKGRTVWGNIVPYGLADGNQYSDNKPFPWRAGANENSTIEVNSDVKIEGSFLPAGKYSLHMIPSKDDWILIFNKNSDLWGSYKYNKEEDALRVTVTPVMAAHEEWLTFGFDEITANSATAYLHWEKLKVPFTIEL